MDQKIVYIVGTGHCGSTLVELLLSQRVRATCVGEVTKKSLKKLLHGSNNNLCSCGDVFEKCDFWRKKIPILIPIFDNDKTTEKTSFHTAWINTIMAEDDDTFYIENTKNVKRLQKIRKLVNKDIFVLRVVRNPIDVGLSFSRKSKRILFYEMLLALRKSEQQDKFLNHSGLKYISVYYEQIISDCESEIDKIIKFLSCENCSMGNAVGSECHLIGGNRSRFSFSGEVTMKKRDLNFIQFLQISVFQYLYRNRLALFQGSSK